MVALGKGALKLSTVGNGNTAVGNNALTSSTTPSNNTAVGDNAGASNTTGANNTIVGKQALQANTTASNNVAVGYQAGYSGTTSDGNVYLGYTAGYNTTGNLNTFIGASSGVSMSTGSKNTILGRFTGNQGGLDIRTSSNNIVLSDGDGNPRVVVDSTGKTKAQSYAETYVALSGTSPAVNCNNGNVFALSTSGNTTFTFSNPPASGTAYGFTLKVTAGGTHTLTWPSSVDWAGGSAPDAPASGETNVLVFITYDGGTTWYGFQAGAALA
jgi:hypothetical protein